MDKSPLAPLDRWLSHVIGTLDPSSRRTLLRRIVTELRRRTQRRMGAQTAPDGSKWAPRKRDSHGKVRAKARMMDKLRQNRQLLAQANADGAELGWHAVAARIALTHHLGEVDEVFHGGPRVKYPARPLIGLPPEDMDYIRDTVLEAVDPGR